MNAATTVIVAAVAAEQKKLRDQLAAKRAYDVDSAVRIVPEGKMTLPQLKHLTKHGQIGETPDGRHYLTDKGRAKQEQAPPSAGQVLLVLLCFAMVIGSLVALTVFLS